MSTGYGPSALMPLRHSGSSCRDPLPENSSASAAPSQEQFSSTSSQSSRSAVSFCNSDDRLREVSFDKTTFNHFCAWILRFCVQTFAKFLLWQTNLVSMHLYRLFERSSDTMIVHLLILSGSFFLCLQQLHLRIWSWYGEVSRIVAIFAASADAQAIEFLWTFMPPTFLFEQHANAPLMHTVVSHHLSDCGWCGICSPCILHFRGCGPAESLVTLAHGSHGSASNLCDMICAC